MKLTEIKKIIAIGNKTGVKRIKMGDFEVEFKEGPSAAVDMDKLAEGFKPAKGLPTEDEMLYWSSGFDAENKEEQPN